MESKGFSIGTLLKRGWHLMMEHIGMFVVFEVLFVIFVGIAYCAVAFFPEIHIALQVLICVVSLLLALTVKIGMFKFSVKVVDGTPPTFTDLFSGVTLLVQWILASIVFGLMVGIPIVIGSLIFYGLAQLDSVVAVFIGMGVIYVSYLVSVYLGVRYWVWPFAMVDKHSNPMTALQKSSTLTCGAMWDVLFMTVAAGFLMYLGVFVVFIGALAAFPVILFAQAGMYRVLESQTKSE